MALAPAWISVPRALSILYHAPSGCFQPELRPICGTGTTTAVSVPGRRRRRRLAVVTAASAASPASARGKGVEFIEEMRVAAMRLHTREQARDGKKEAPMEPPVAKWQPTVEGYLRFLVDSKLVFDTLDDIVHRATVPWYAEFQNTGLERSEPLQKDLAWFSLQGYAIPEPSAPGITYASYLEELSDKDPQAFLCHFYNVHFAHTAGGRIIGEKVAEKIHIHRELEFYQWEGDLSLLQQNVRGKLNQVASGWSRAEKDTCLDEMEKAFASSIDLRRHMFP
ncbi:hypothetical protein U9M48_037611 [Paspalum notatum var. saurae]|uniref:heme oxygenase (biliverdin-producing) n=1 Tax=Paspalum notatum var. saurae TaxID=547442 RepID=A0AAQ3UK39_PASNO